MTKDTLSAVQQITFEQILPIWQHKLWPNRVSLIETHSAMTWPSSHPNQPYDMNVFNYPVYFFGIYDQDKLIAVNSGHLTTITEFRSRGLWVDPSFRNKGLASELLAATVDQAIVTKATMVWSVPRVSAAHVYEKVGFTTIGIIITDGVEFGPNIYCYKAINIR
jgi:GNAT superfamily N-acetyltransferase